MSKNMKRKAIHIYLHESISRVSYILIVLYQCKTGVTKFTADFCELKSIIAFNP